MNAPTRAIELLEAKVELLPLTAIAPSETHIQALRRQRFTKDELKDLADSITKTRGVLQPIVVRPLAALRGLAKYEIVAGERRWLASKIAGLAHIQASVREISDQEVLEVQLIENLQRKGLHELEEAEGYDELMKLKKITAEQLVDMVGKSRSYVYARLKLLALCPEARKAFYAGELDASRALLIARIGHHDTQRQALKAVTQGEYWARPDVVSRGPRAHRAQLHAEARRGAVRHQGRRAPAEGRRLHQVPEAHRQPGRPLRRHQRCRRLHRPEVLRGKARRHMAAALKALEAKGKKVIHGDAAKQDLPALGKRQRLDAGRLPGDQPDHLGGGKNQKIADLLGKDFEPTLMSASRHRQGPQGRDPAADRRRGPRARSPSPAGLDVRQTPTARPGTGDFEVREKVALRIAGERRSSRNTRTLSHAELVYLVDREHESWEATDDSLYKAFKLTPVRQPREAEG
jgi:ParB/RepB/Spo0J family partition protein